MIEFTCLSCQASYRVPEEFQGKRTVCRRCRRPLEVPTLMQLTEDDVISPATASTPLATAATADTGPGLADERRGTEGWWQRLLGETCACASATGRHIVTVGAYLWHCVRVRRLRGRATAAQLALAEELQRCQIGDHQRCEQLAALNQQLQAADTTKKTSRQVVSRREQLLLELSEPFLRASTVPPPVERAWQEAHTASVVRDDQQRHLCEVGSALRPAGWAGWLRLGVGYGVAMGAVALLWLAVAPRPTRRADDTVRGPVGAPAVAAVDPGRSPRSSTPVVSEAVGPSLVITEKPLLVLEPGGHSSSVRSAVFTPDGKHVITGSHDKTIRVWDVSSGELIRVLRLPIGPGSEGSIHSLALSPNGKTVAVGGYPFGSGKYGVPIYLVDLESGSVEKVLKGHTDAIQRLIFAPDGKRLASAGGDRTVRVYDLKTGQPDMVLESQAVPRDLAFAPDGKHLASVDTVGRIWSLTTGRAEAVLSEGNHPSLSVAWSPDGKTVAIGNLDATISLWNPDGKHRKTLTGLRNQVVSVSFAADSKTLLFTGVGYGAGNALEFGSSLVDTESGREMVRFKGHNNTVIHGSLSRDGTLAVSSGGDDQDTWIWRTSDGTPVQRLVGKGSAMWAVGWGSDGKSISWGTTNRRASHTDVAPLERVFDLEHLEFSHEPGKFLRAQLTRGTRSFALDRDFHMLIKDGDQVVHKFDGASAQDRVYCFTWLPDGRAVVGTAFGLFLYDAGTGKVLRQYTGHSGIILAVAPSPDGKRFITGSLDQTIRFWDLEKERSLLSLFVADQDWIAWTEEGVYAASANGERLMGWQVNNGPEAMASYHSAAQFRKSLYHPNVVRNVIRAGNLAQAFALAGEKPDQLTSVAQVLPPSVAITAPAGIGSVRLPPQPFEVTATARSVGDNPVTALRLLVNGRPYRGPAGVLQIVRPKLGELRLSWKIELPPGVHVLSVVGESAVSRALSAPVEVTILGGSADDRPCLYVLAVGINDYPGRMKLHFAVPDAEAITESFKDKGGGLFRTTEVKLIKDSQATRREIEQGLAWLGAKMTPKDVGIVFLSGHGARDDDGTFYFIPVDVNIRNLAGSCVAGDYLKKTLGDMPGRIITILDACHSGAAGDRQRRPAVADDLVRDLITEDYGIIVMSSSQGREFSLESPVVQHGFFTLALIEGLAGKADYNRDGFVYLNELDAYAARRVKELSHGEQNPVIAKPPTIRWFPLAKR